MKKPVTKLVDMSLSELSLVTRGANQHANISILKAHDAPLIEDIVKYLSTSDGANSFNEFYADERNRQRANNISQHLWPVIDALRESLVSIYADGSLSDDEKQSRVAESVAQFVATSQHPVTHDNGNSELLKLFEQVTEENSNMSEELKKKADELTAQVAELTKSLEAATLLSKMTDDEKEYLASLNDAAKADEFRAASSADRAKLMKKSAESDEVFKSAEGHEIRKSAVGDGVFAILKSQDEALRATREEMVKAADRAQTVEFTKRAEEDFANLPGETVAKVAVLKGINGMSDEAKATLAAMLKAGNDALAKGFQNFGTGYGKPQDMTKAAKLESLIAKAREADPTLSKAAAETKVLSANPELYEG